MTFYTEEKVESLTFLLSWFIYFFFVCLIALSQSEVSQHTSGRLHAEMCHL